MASTIMSGCGDKKPAEGTEITSEATSESTESTTSEVEVTEESTEVKDTNEINVSEYVTESIVDGKLVIKAKNVDTVWQQFNDGFVEVTEETDGEYTIFTVTGTEASPTSINLLGDVGTNRISYLVMFDVKEDLTIDEGYKVDSFVSDMSDMDVPEIPAAEEDLDKLINDTLAVLGENNLPGALATRGINLTDVNDVFFALGVESLDGLNGAAISEPMMTSVAYQLVALRFDDNASAQKAAKSLLETAPTDKWVCVTPDEVKTKVVNDTYVLFFMGSKDAAANFEK